MVGSQLATAPVVVATRDIAEGTSIDRAAVNVAQWPAATVPAGAYGSVDSVVGRVARVAVFSGEPIVPGRLAPEGTGPGLEVKITPGKRAMGVRINDVSGISGMILPGSRVDILLLLSNRDNAAASGNKVGKLFMENMRILAMGTSLQRGNNGEPIQTSVATLEVTPEESERLLVAQSQGQIQLTLRGYGDPDSAKTSGASVEDVVGMLRDRDARPAPAPTKPAARPAAPAPKPAEVPAPVAATKAPPRPDSLSVRIYRGRTQSEQKFQKDSAARRDTMPA
jgi:pilus assembly protein CpaB